MSLAAGCTSYVSVYGGVGEYKATFDTAVGSSHDRKLKEDAQVVGIRGDFRPDWFPEFLSVGNDFESVLSEGEFSDEAGDEDAEVLDWEYFPFIGFHPQIHERLRIPIKLGLLVKSLSMDFEDTNEDQDWFTIGGKGSAGLELDLIKTEVNAFGIFGEAFFLGGRTEVDADFLNSKQPSNMWGYGYEGGIRYQFKALELRASYIFRLQEIAESDEDRFFLSVNELQTEIRAFALGVGVVF